MSSNAPQEIERKFLVAAPPSLDGLRKETVRQGYISATQDTTEVRVRQKGDGHYLTVKCGGMVQRTEYEVAISQAQFDTLWPATDGRRVEKTRYTGTLTEDLSFELDVYGGALAPLMVVEVEFHTRADADTFTAPAWFGTDVSADKRFKNKNLAVAEHPPIA